MPYLYSWVWSCSIEPRHWELSNIRWHSIPPACNLGCTQSGSQRQQQSCSPYDGHSWAQGLSCTGWHLSVAQLWRDGRKDKMSAGFLKILMCLLDDRFNTLLCYTCQKQTNKELRLLLDIYGKCHFWSIVLFYTVTALVSTLLPTQTQVHLP